MIHLVAILKTSVAQAAENGETFFKLNYIN